MKQFRLTLLRSINLMLASTIAALGFACCHQKNSAKNKKVEENNADMPEIISSDEQQQMVCMYGVPRAEYIVHGVVLDQKGSPLKLKEVTVKSRYDEMHVTTDKDGSFDIRFDGFPAEELTFEIDGKKYVEPVTYDGEPVDNWNRGTATMEVKITHAGKYQQDPPIMLKYGVPPIRMEK